MLSGIDVSHLQGNVQWGAVAASGKSFAFVKASQGVGFHDSHLAQNVAGARVAGLAVGLYHFITADPADAQAQNFLMALKNVNGGNTTLPPGFLPCVLDVEAITAPPQDIAAIVQEWLTVVSQATGQPAMVYCSPGWWNGAVAPAMPLPGCLFWLAEYGVLAPHLPTGALDWTFWQYSGSGTCSGVSTAVDLNQFNGAESDLQALARLQA